MMKLYYTCLFVALATVTTLWSAQESIASSSSPSNAQFKIDLNELLKRGRSLSRSDSAISPRCEEEERARSASPSVTRSESPSVKRARSGSSSTPRLDKDIEKIFRKVDELIVDIKHGEDIEENKRMIAHALALLLKPFWKKGKNGSAKDIDNYLHLLQSPCIKLADFTEQEDSMSLVTSEQVKDKVRMLLNSVPYSNTGTTFILEASKKPNASLICLENLLTLGADPNSRDKFGLTPLHYLAKALPQDKPNKETAKDVVDLLMSRGGEINALDEQNKTPLAWAKQLQAENVIEALTQTGKCEG